MGLRFFWGEVEGCSRRAGFGSVFGIDLTGAGVRRSGVRLTGLGGRG